MDCRDARELYIGSVGAPAGAVAEARAHLAACPACRERLDAFSAAALSGDDDEISCAECLGRVSRSGSDEPVDAGHLDLLAARHLDVCPLCAAVVAELSPTLAALEADTLPEPPRYPRVDTAFLPRPSPASSPTHMPQSAGRPFGRLPRWVVAALMATVALVGLWRAFVPAASPPQQAAGATATSIAPSPPAASATIPAGATPLSDPAPGPTLRSTAAAPTDSPTRTEAAPASTALPPTADPGPTADSSGSIALLPPTLTDQASGLLRLAWQAPALPAGNVFDVRVCAGAGCQPTLGRTNVAEPLWLWCPDEGAGSYRWQVVVIDAASKQVTGPSSEVGSWDWAGGECAEPPSTPPTPLPEPTSEEPGPEP